MNKDLRSLIGLIFLIGVIVFFTSGVTVNGKHYGVRSCSCAHGVEIDNGAERQP